jgi:hypothetical protein
VLTAAGFVLSRAESSPGQDVLAAMSSTAWQAAGVDLDLLPGEVWRPLFEVLASRLPEARERQPARSCRLTRVDRRHRNRAGTDPHADVPARKRGRTRRHDPDSS